MHLDSKLECVYFYNKPSVEINAEVEGPWKDIYYDLFYLISTYLPTDDWLAMSRTCKSWNSRMIRTTSTILTREVVAVIKFLQEEGVIFKQTIPLMQKIWSESILKGGDETEKSFETQPNEEKCEMDVETSEQSEVPIYPMTVQDELSHLSDDELKKGINEAIAIRKLIREELFQLDDGKLNALKRNYNQINGRQRFLKNVFALELIDRLTKKAENCDYPTRAETLKNLALEWAKIGELDKAIEVGKKLGWGFCKDDIILGLIKAGNIEDSLKVLYQSIDDKLIPVVNVVRQVTDNLDVLLELHDSSSREGIDFIRGCLFELGVKAIKLGELENAKNIMGKIPERSQDYYCLAMRLAEKLATIGEPEEAFRWLSRVDSCYRLTDVLVSVFSSALNNKCFRVAEQVVDLMSTCQDAFWGQLVLAHFEAGNNEEAERVGTKMKTRLAKGTIEIFKKAVENGAPPEQIKKLEAAAVKFTPSREDKDLQNASVKESSIGNFSGAKKAVEQIQDKDLRTRTKVDIAKEQGIKEGRISEVAFPDDCTSQGEIDVNLFGNYLSRNNLGEAGKIYKRQSIYFREMNALLKNHLHSIFSELYFNNNGMDCIDNDIKGIYQKFGSTDVVEIIARIVAKKDVEKAITIIAAYFGGTENANFFNLLKDLSLSELTQIAKDNSTNKNITFYVSQTFARKGHFSLALSTITNSRLSDKDSIIKRMIDPMGEPI